MISLETILLATDFSGSARRAFEPALRLAQASGARLMIVHTLEEAGVDEPELERAVRRRLRASAEHDLSQMMRQSKPTGVHTEVEICPPGIPAKAILDKAVEREAGLIVLGAHGRRRRQDLGAVAQEVFRRAEVPVLTVPERLEGETEEEDTFFRRLLVPTDFSEASGAALQSARTLGMAFDSRAFLFHVVEEFVPPAVYGLDVNPIRDLAGDIERRAREEMHRIAAAFEEVGVPAENHIASGHAPSEIVRFAAEHSIDTVVQASRDGRVERFLVGSVADRVVRAAQCPVLTVQPTGRTLVLQ